MKKSKLDLIEECLEGYLDEVQNLKKGRDLLHKMYHEYDFKGEIPWEIMREVHCYFGYDKGEDE